MVARLDHRSVAPQLQAEQRLILYDGDTVGGSEGYQRNRAILEQALLAEKACDLSGLDLMAGKKAGLALHVDEEWEEAVIIARWRGPSAASSSIRLFS
eukprot:gene40577-36822_t